MQERASLFARDEHKILFNKKRGNQAGCSGKQVLMRFCGESFYLCLSTFLSFWLPGVLFYGFSWFQVDFSLFQDGFHVFSWFQVGFSWF